MCTLGTYAQGSTRVGRRRPAVLAEEKAECIDQEHLKWNVFVPWDVYVGLTGAESGTLGYGRLRITGLQSRFLGKDVEEPLTEYIDEITIHVLIHGYDRQKTFCSASG